MHVLLHQALPAEGDYVIGIITGSPGENYNVDIGTASNATSVFTHMHTQTYTLEHDDMASEPFHLEYLRVCVCVCVCDWYLPLIAGSLIRLHNLSFEGATKRNRPRLKVCGCAGHPGVQCSFTHKPRAARALSRSHMKLFAVVLIRSETWCTHAYS